MGSSAPEFPENPAMGLEQSMSRKVGKCLGAGISDFEITLLCKPAVSKKLPPYGKAASDCPGSKALVIRRGNILQYLIHPATEDPAEVVQGRGGDGLVLAQLVDGGAGYMVILYERVCGFRRFFQGFPEGVINNHTIASPFWYDSQL